MNRPISPGEVQATPPLFAVLILVILEGLLSIDNALVLGLLAKRLPRFAYFPFGGGARMCVGNSSA